MPDSSTANYWRNATFTLLGVICTVIVSIVLGSLALAPNIVWRTDYAAAFQTLDQRLARIEEMIDAQTQIHRALGDNDANLSERVARIEVTIEQRHGRLD